MPFDWEVGADPVKIPYSPLIYVDDLLNGNKRDIIEPALTSKFLFYGPDIDVARDDFANPVFSFRSDDAVLPGVFFHAMALENMIDLKQHIKSPRPAGLRLMWLRDVWAIGIICLVLLVSRLIFASESKLRDIMLIVMTSVSIASIEFFGFNWAPSNWIGVFSFVTIARVTNADELFENAVRRLKAASGERKKELKSKLNENQPRD
jgi:hypothetical protein